VYALIEGEPRRTATTFLCLLTRKTRAMDEPTVCHTSCDFGRENDEYEKTHQEELCLHHHNRELNNLLYQESANPIYATTSAVQAQKKERQCFIRLEKKSLGGLCTG
jgi:hypothetical protein